MFYISQLSTTLRSSVNLMVKTTSMSTAEIADNTEMAENITIADVMKSLMRIEPSINAMKDDLSQIRSEIEKMKTEQKHETIVFIAQYCRHREGIVNN